MGKDTCKLFFWTVRRTYNNTDLFINTKMIIISPSMIAPPPAEPAIISKKKGERVFTFGFIIKKIKEVAIKHVVILI